jgi:hypothetical protein
LHFVNKQLQFFTADSQLKLPRLSLEIDLELDRESPENGRRGAFDPKLAPPPLVLTMPPPPTKLLK